MKQCIFVLKLLTLVSLSHSLPLTYTYYSTPNYRTSSLSPLSSAPSNSWVITSLTTPGSWFYSYSSSVLSFTGNGNTGMSATFSISQTGFYTVEFELNNSQATQVNTSLWFNSSVISVSNVMSLNMFKFMRNFVAQNYAIHIWLENLVILNSVRIYATPSYRPTSINLRHYPSQKLLLLITNISVSSIVNMTTLMQNTKVLLKYRSVLAYNCLNSVDTAINPQNYCNYSQTTNFLSLSAGYTIFSANSNATLMNGLSSGIVVLAVTNINLDCTVEVQVNLAQGNILNDGYWNVFNITANQTAQYVQQYMNMTLSVKYVVYMEPVQTIVYYDLQPGYFNPLWSIYAMYINTVANSIPCYNIWTFITAQSISICCINANNMVSSLPFVSSPAPGFYLRDKNTSKLINLNMVDTLPLPHGYVIQTFAQAKKFYYIPDRVLQIVYNITVNQVWRSNLTSTMIRLNINGVQISSNSINIVPNTTNVTARVQQISVVYTDTIQAYLDSMWKLNTAQGYHYQYRFLSQPNVNLVNYSLPGYIAPTPSAPSVNNSSNSFANPNSITPQSSNANSENAVKFIIPPDTIYQILRFTKYYIKSWGFFLFNYFINTLINFQTLTFMYYFINLKNANLQNKKAVADTMLILEEQTSYLYIFNNLFKSDVQFGVTDVSIDKIQGLPSANNPIKYNDYGINSDFFRNNGDSLLHITISALKIIIIRLLVALPSQWIKGIFKGLLQIWDEMFLIQIVMMAPSLIIVLGIYFSQNERFSVVNCLDMLSNALIISISFVTLIFMMWKHCIRIKRKKQKWLYVHRLNQKWQKRSKFELQKIIHLQNFRLFDNSMFILIPLLIGFNVNSIFILFTLSTLLYRLSTLITKRKYYSPLKFIKTLISKLLWIAFTSIYGLYWLTQIFQVDCSTSTWLQVMLICDFMQVLLLLAGCIFQILFTLIETIRAVYVQIRSRNKCQPINDNPALALIQNQVETSKTKTSKQIIVKTPKNYFNNQDNQSILNKNRKTELKKINNFLQKAKSGKQ